MHAIEARDVRVGDHIGRHVLIMELGRGGMGRIFVAHDAALDRLVAIKFISTLSAERVERFLAEARITARCMHPNIVTVHEIGQHDGAPYLVLEHLAGASLEQLAHDEPIPVSRVVAIMTAVAQALACAHSHQIVHCDLKPSNIVVLPDGTAKVLDFGIAVDAKSRIATDDRVGGDRRPSEIEGTLPYMAPEQLLGGPVDARVDIWAFGVVLHELLTSVRPFDHLDEAAMRAELLDLEQPTPPISRHRSVLPSALVDVAQRCLAKSPARRFQSTNDLVDAMHQIGADRTPRPCSSCSGRSAPQVVS